ncbi:hypothetical protein BG000_006152 [Podila horticola]|nr:hypothetical protein BG000_006152 [Podila horticola]
MCPDEILPPRWIRHYLRPQDGTLENNGLMMMPVQRQSAQGSMAGIDNNSRLVEPQSWMGHMRQAYDEFMAGERPNLYGEWWF